MDETAIIASVSDRSQRDLKKRVNNTDKVWAPIEKQLLHVVDSVFNVVRHSRRGFA